jgi:hypothetical protein
VRVVWDRHSFPRYRFSIDDSSFFLRDIYQQGYRSLSDCFCLAMLRTLHQDYGVKSTVDIHYTTADGFDLAQFSDRYKGEWRDCSDWLKLAFHARADKPDRPYQDAPPEKLLADLDQVALEIHRFAGTQSYAPPTAHPKSPRGHPEPGCAGFAAGAGLGNRVWLARGRDKARAVRP